MTPADRLLLLDVMFDVHVTLADDGEHLIARGPEAALEAAEPSLRLHKPELIAQLRSLAAPVRPG
jgi:hypothetical protein